MPKKYRPWLKSLSGLFLNFSAAWFGIAFITPNFRGISALEDFLALTVYLMFGIVYLIASMIIEYILEYERE